MKHRRHLTIAAFLLTFVSPAMAAEWHWMNAGTNKSYWYFDKATVEKAKPIVRIWIKSVRTETVDSDGAWATASREEYNCQTRTVRTVSAADYDKSDNFIRSYKSPNSTPSELIPGSVGETALQMVCKPDFPMKKDGNDYGPINESPVERTRKLVEYLESQKDPAPK